MNGNQAGGDRTSGEREPTPLREKAYEAFTVRLIRQELTRLDADLVQPVMREHMAIVDALAARDREGAVRAFCDHIESARSRALGL